MLENDQQGPLKEGSKNQLSESEIEDQILETRVGIKTPKTSTRIMNQIKIVAKQ